MKKLLIALLILMLGTMPALATEIPGLVWESSMEKTTTQPNSMWIITRAVMP